MPASPHSAPQRIRRYASIATLASAALAGLLAFAPLTSAAEDSYPGAARAPWSRSGWEGFSMRVDPDAPADEAQGGKTLAGTKVNKRGEKCFPTYEGDLFSELDLVRGADGKLSSVFDKAKAKPEDAAQLAQAIRGQSSWMLWSEGDEAFWGWLVEHNYGFTDFLVLLDSRQREHRFRDAGLVNQPGMTAQKDPAKKILGLYLDQNRGAPGGAYSYGRAGCAPFEHTDEERYAKALARLATDSADPDVYGYPSGVIGLRLFPNPDFFAKTPAAAEVRRYWKIRVEDQPGDDYYKPESLIAADPKLVRPFRIGMTCAFCHIGPHPLNPPKDPEDPEWANLSSTIGAQYWNGSKAFSNLKGPKSFLFQLVQSWQPGTLDTSLISTDQINNPNTMNALWEVPARMGRAMLNPREMQSAANLLIPSIEEKQPGANPRHTPRILIDGSDSVGISGALSRVYLNIGAYYEQWIRLHNPILGFRAQRPFEMATIRDQSVFWRVTEKQRIPEILAFFTYENRVGENVTQPMKLADAPEGKEVLAKTQNEAQKGRAVFVENCAICHSSKQPKDFEITFSRAWEAQPVPGPGEAAHVVLPMDFAEWEDFKRGAPYREYVKRISETAGAATSGSDPFLEGNYLSTDIRVPVTLAGTNSSRAVGTNAMKGQVWDNFSSDAYKNLPAVGEVHFYNPYSGARVDEWGNNDTYTPPGGGPGYYRPASLVSIWATAPFLHNNALGRYTGEPSVAGRLDAFNDAIDKLLSRAKRVPSPNDRPGDLRYWHPELAGHDPGFIYRTTTASWIDFPATFIRPLLVGVMGERLTSWLTRYLWYVLAGIAVLFVFFGRQQDAGFTLLLIAVLVGIVLRVSGIDTIYPSLWLLPIVVVALALLLWLGPQGRSVAPVFFALLAAGFLLVSFVATSWVDGKRGGISLGPIPQGTPVNLLMSFNPQAPKLDLLDAVSGLTRGLLRVRKDYPLLGERVSADALKRHVDGDDPEHYNGSALAAFEREAGLPLLKVSKCPDLVLDRGHWFAEKLSAEQKQQLKAFLKTL